MVLLLRPLDLTLLLGRLGKDLVGHRGGLRQLERVAGLPGGTVAQRSPSAWRAASSISVALALVVLVEHEAAGVEDRLRLAVERGRLLPPLARSPARRAATIRLNATIAGDAQLEREREARALVGGRGREIASRRSSTSARLPRAAASDGGIAEPTAGVELAARRRRRLRRASPSDSGRDAELVRTSGLGPRR